MKKVYIKTFGCQMNEYDSDKMVDVLHHHDGMIKTDTPEDARLNSFKYMFGARKGPRKSFF